MNHKDIWGCRLWSVRRYLDGHRSQVSRASRQRSCCEALRVKKVNIIFLLALNSIFFISCYMKPTAEGFNKTAAASKSKPDKVIQSLHINEGMFIADIGAGGGYFAERFSYSVGANGLVYAVDINKSFLTYIEDQLNKKNIQNIQTILAKTDESNLPDSCCDIIFLRNVYHHINSPIDYFRKLKSKLKKYGVVAIIDYKPASFFSLHFFTFANIFNHNTDPETILKEMNLAGYQKIQKFRFLKTQSFQVFKNR